MSSPGELENRLREEAQRTLTPLLSELQQELRALQNHVSSSVGQLEHKLSAFENLDFGFAEPLVQGAVDQVVREKVQEATDRTILEQNDYKAFVARSARNLRKAETQEEILSLLMESAARFAPKTLLFVIRGEDFTAWSSAGYSEESAQKIASQSLPKPASPMLAQALETGELVSVTDLSSENTLRELLHEETRSPWHAFPLRAIQRPVAVLVAAEAEGRSCDLDALSLIMDAAGLCIENLALKILQEMKAAAPKPQAAPTPRMPEPERQKPETEAAPSPEIPAFAAPVENVHVAEPAAVPESFAVLQPAAGEQQVGGSPTETAAAHPSTIEFPTPVREEPPVESMNAAAAVEVLPPAPPIPMIPREAPKISEDDRLHSDAKRFARLLVSEIKLYNEHRVAEGRTHRDLYTRLKRDIDRSREMYEKRVSPTVTHKVDYFHDEVVRILGENDPGTLGHDYPGPRVGSC